MTQPLPLVDELPFHFEEREGRDVAVVSRDCRMPDDLLPGRYVTFRAGEYLGHVTETDDADKQDALIRTGDVRAAARFALAVERDPIAVELSKASERFMRNPGGREPNVPYETTHALVSKHIADGKSLTAALYDANQALRFSAKDTPEALDKVWRRILKRGFKNPLDT